MAPHYAGGPRLGLGNINRITPGPKRHFITNMLRLVTGMRIMTGRTGPTFFTINMEIMQVIAAVSEAGQGFGDFGFGDIPVMTAETEVVIFRSVGTVKIHGIKPRQQLGVLGTMRIMTGGAIPGLNRTVPILAGCHSFAKIAMAGETELFHGILQQGGII